MVAIRIEKILLPTDFSTHSLKAFNWASELARNFTAEVVLLHVFDTRVVENIYHIHQHSPERAREELQQVAEGRIADLVGGKDAQDLAISAVYAEGIPPVEVKRVAEEIGADLIVMGSHGSTGLSQLLYGSTAEGVARGAPCPVLTINPDV